MKTLGGWREDDGRWGGCQTVVDIYGTIVFECVAIILCLFVLGSASWVKDSCDEE